MGTLVCSHGTCLKTGKETIVPDLIAAPTVIPAAGSKPKIIQEYVGHLNSGTSSVSIAQMKSPQGWAEPGQRPEFNEYTVVLRGTLHLRTKDGETMKVAATQAVIVHAGEWVQYSTPDPEGCEYIAVCLPAFSPNLVHRDAE